MHEKHSIRNHVISVLNSPTNNPANSHHANQIIRTLSKNNNIVITRSDKGSRTVIMNTTDYISGMNQILNNSDVFTPATAEEQTVSNSKYKKELRTLCRNKIITTDELQGFLSNLHGQAYIYGLPKRTGFVLPNLWSTQLNKETEDGITDGGTTLLEEIAPTWPRGGDLSRRSMEMSTPANFTNLAILGLHPSAYKVRRTPVIKAKTISRRLVANGLHSCRPLRRLPLTPPNRRQRLEWCRARSTWMTEWHRVVFSDESRFCLSSDSRRVRVWRRRGERSNPAAIVERPTVRQRGIMVWGAIAYDSRSPLLRIQGTMTAQRYVDDVLRPVTLPYLQGVPNALYQQDNAQPHTARISQQALQDVHVQMLPWPPYSPDLSPIEHVWDIIGRRLHALPQPRSEDELWQMVKREWRAIPQDAIRTLIDSLPRRVAACIAVRGGPTCY
ncbi:hypothetical protein LAZ67_5003859 [Cordylochernes scorpioides]|uniref:Transposase n=1 Tax=Cordylochernes scorpioides TaxID=51811 RepID=A0ABY6KHJ5_9ARAC|nr:hypothetical protein LAZ67_5003859 [Cordylochernes scorpioides]